MRLKNNKTNDKNSSVTEYIIRVQS